MGLLVKKNHSRVPPPANFFAKLSVVLLHLKICVGITLTLLYVVYDYSGA